MPGALPELLGALTPPSQLGEQRRATPLPAPGPGSPRLAPAAPMRRAAGLSEPRAERRTAAFRSSAAPDPVLLGVSVGSSLHALGWPGDSGLWLPEPQPRRRQPELLPLAAPAGPSRPKQQWGSCSSQPGALGPEPRRLRDRGRMGGMGGMERDEKDRARAGEREREREIITK